MRQSPSRRPGLDAARRVPVTVAALMLTLGPVACSGAAQEISNGQSSASQEPVVEMPTSAAGDPPAVPSTSPPASPSPPTPPSSPDETKTGDSPTAADDGPALPEADVPEPAVLREGQSRPVEDPYYPDLSNPEVDVLHYFLALDWDGELLSGETTVTFRATQQTSSVRLDLSDVLTVGDVTLDGEPIEHEQGDDAIVFATGALSPGASHSLVVPYVGTPQPTPAPSGRLDMTEGLGWNVDSDGSVYTFQEPYGAFTWYPVNDHPSDKALYDAAITAYGDDVGVFNGTLTSSDEYDGTTTNWWHLDEPAASYLVTVAIGPYTEHVEPTPSGMDISYWLRPQDESLLPRLEDDAEDAFEWAEAHLGDYPFSSLGYVVVGGNSAMETQTMITISREAVERPDAVVLHELSHQWFGDSVTPRDWQGLWLNEGWAMYVQQWFEVDTSRSRYAGGIKNWPAYDRAARRNSGPPGDYEPESFGDVNVYLGPALMLDRIRQRIGDEAFTQVVRAWPAEHEGQTVDRAVFTRWLNAETGRDFTSLIAAWLDSERTPR